MINQNLSTRVSELSVNFETIELDSEPEKQNIKRKHQVGKRSRHKRRVKRVKLENSYFTKQCIKFYQKNGPNIDTSSKKPRPYFKVSDILGAGYLYRHRGSEPPFCMGYVDYARQTIVPEKPQVSEEHVSPPGT